MGQEDPQVRGCGGLWAPPAPVPPRPADSELGQGHGEGAAVTLTVRLARAAGSTERPGAGRA